ncbi:MAG TPA: hypothetical protein VFZ00_00915 [Solirubrobacter sp.]|nr:hypothetical protein [Solirubrobacter sp.]
MHDQPQVGLDHPILRGQVAAFDAKGERAFLRRGQEWRTSDTLEKQREALVVHFGAEAENQSSRNPQQRAQAELKTALRFMRS